MSCDPDTKSRLIERHMQPLHSEVHSLVETEVIGMVVGAACCPGW